MSRIIEIGVTNECQGCDLMKLKTYNHDILPYCTLFKTFLQFREYENDDWIVKPCYECVECTNGVIFIILKMVSLKKRKNDLMKRSFYWEIPILNSQKEY